MPAETTPRKIAKLPEVLFKQILCTQDGRGEAGKRLPSLYVSRLPGPEDRWLVTNFTGAMVVIEGLYPFPEPTYMKTEQPEPVEV